MTENMSVTIGGEAIAVPVGPVTLGAMRKIEAAYERGFMASSLTTDKAGAAAIIVSAFLQPTRSDLTPQVIEGKLLSTEILALVSQVVPMVVATGLYSLKDPTPGEAQPAEDQPAS